MKIQPVTKERLAKFKEPYVDENARRFIEEHDLVWNPVTMRYDCDRDVVISDDIVSDGKIKIRFGHVKGYFNCSYSNLTTLEGAPKEVSGSFYCNNNNLTSLEGAPQKVGWNFDCERNKLTTLEGAPKEVGGSFYCNNNKKLTSLEGAPKEIGGIIEYNHNLIDNIKK